MAVSDDALSKGETRHKMAVPGIGKVKFTMPEKYLMLLTDMNFNGSAGWNPANVSSWENCFPQSGAEHIRSGDSLRSKWKSDTGKPENLLAGRRAAVAWAKSGAFGALADGYVHDPWLGLVPKKVDNFIAKFKLDGLVTVSSSGMNGKGKPAIAQIFRFNPASKELMDVKEEGELAAEMETGVVEKPETDVVVDKGKWDSDEKGSSGSNSPSEDMIEVTDVVVMKPNTEFGESKLITYGSN
jgi:hypothetical protein